VGARFGATLALAAAPRIARAVALALWEPKWSGRALLDDLLQTHREVLPSSAAAQGEGGADAARDVLGFEIPARLWEEIAAFEPDDRGIAPDLDVLLVGSARALDADGRLLGHERLFLQPVQHPREWLQPERGMYDVLVPAAALAHLARWIAERR
jgi:hypothetical protein